MKYGVDPADIPTGEIVDRCCCECGNHFDGESDDDYCPKCWDELAKLPQEDLPR